MMWDTNGKRGGISGENFSPLRTQKALREFQIFARLLSRKIIAGKRGSSTPASATANASAQDDSARI
jgi:hypothetical protein